MREKRGYFSLLEKEDGLYLKVILVECGEIINVEEIEEYFKRHKIENVDLISIDKFIKNMIVDEKEIKISEEKLELVIDEEMKIYITKDNMNVIAKMYPPVNGGKMLELEDIEEALGKMGVKAGINQKDVSAFLKYRRYEKLYTVSEGKEVVQGEEAKIKYYFNIDTSIVRPKEKEDGSVDFKELNMINRVEEGTLLAELEPEKIGEEGINVFGKKIKPDRIKSVVLRVGKNVVLSEDGTKAYSEVAGHVELLNGVVLVEDEYVIDGDVGVKTGNIEYKGNLCVNGNVDSGYFLKVDGSIMIHGTVEGATIEATKDIIVANGIGGMQSSNIKTEGNLIAKFIENSTIKTGKSVYSEIIMHSVITAGIMIEVHAGKGTIVGGTQVAGYGISCKNVGSVMGTTTNLQVLNSFGKKTKNINGEEKEEIFYCYIKVEENIYSGVKMKIEKSMKFFRGKCKNVKISKRNGRILEEFLK